VLTNPKFLFRVESDPEKAPAGGVYRISDLELASRLSFFLWSTIPDEELLAVADEGRLSEPAVLDEQVGRILRAVESGPHRDNTLIVLFGDHGFHLGEKEVWAKQTLWEDGTRVPLIVAGPGIPEGRVCDQPVQLLDVMPTLVDLCGLPPGRPMDGRSLAPLLKNPDADWPGGAGDTGDTGDDGSDGEEDR